MSVFFARPIRFNGVRAVDVEDTDEKRANAAIAHDINMVAADSPSRRRSMVRKSYGDGIASDMWRAA